MVSIRSAMLYGSWYPMPLAQKRMFFFETVFTYLFSSAAGTGDVATN